MKARFIKVKQKKFEKLSDANKIRYHLGVISANQFRNLFILKIISMVILGYLLILPFYIWYVDMGRILILAGLGFLAILGACISFFFGGNKLNKSHKELEDFLNGKQKK